MGGKDLANVGCCLLRTRRRLGWVVQFAVALPFGDACNDLREQCGHLGHLTHVNWRKGGHTALWFAALCSREAFIDPGKTSGPRKRKRTRQYKAKQNRREAAQGSECRKNQRASACVSLYFKCSKSLTSFKTGEFSKNQNCYPDACLLGLGPWTS